MIQVSNICKSFHSGTTSLHVLQGISLSVQQGEFLSIMGKSGSGKSTFLHILGCLDVPTSGKYFLDGIDVLSVSDDERARLRSNHIGFVFQTFNLLNELTVYENVELPFLYRMETPDCVDEKVRTALDRVGLGRRLHHKPGELSGGEMQRVAIARALCVRPKIILADEPTGNLDSTNTRDVLLLFQQLHAEYNTTIILITHDRDVAAQTQRRLLLRDGVLIDEKHV